MELTCCNPNKRDFIGRSSRMDWRRTSKNVFLASLHVPFDRHCWFPPGNSIAQNLCLDDKLKTAFDGQLLSGIHCHCSWCKVGGLLDIPCEGSLLPLLFLKCVKFKPSLGSCSHLCGPWCFHPYNHSEQWNGGERRLIFSFESTL